MLSDFTAGGVACYENPLANVLPGAGFMPDYPPSAYAEIDLAALSHNYRYLCRSARPGLDLLAVVKADAYGHGAVPVSRALAAAGAPLFAVASAAEGARLRAAGIEQPILVMGWIAPGEEGSLFEQQLTPYLFSLDDARRFHAAAVAAGKKLKFHLKIDTGMGRIGFAPEEFGAVLPVLKGLDHLELDGVMSHCARADEPQSALTGEQVARFDGALQSVIAAGYNPRWRHLANSAALVRDVVPPLEDVHEAQQDRRLDAPLHQVVHQGAQVDGVLGMGRGVDADVPLLVDGEEAVPPVVHVVDADGILDRPAFHVQPSSAK